MLNRFQRWAYWCGRAHGFIVLPCGNWVKMAKGDEPFVTVMSVQGVQALCAANA